MPIIILANACECRMWKQFPAIQEYKNLRFEASLGANFCDYNRDFYKKLSLESVPLAEKAREKHPHSFHQAQKKSLRMLSILQRLLGDLPVVHPQLVYQHAGSQGAPGNHHRRRIRGIVRQPQQPRALTSQFIYIKKIRSKTNNINSIHYICSVTMKY